MFVNVERVTCNVFIISKKKTNPLKVEILKIVDRADNLGEMKRTKHPSEKWENQIISIQKLLKLAKN